MFDSQIKICLIGYNRIKCQTIFSVWEKHVILTQMRDDCTFPALRLNCTCCMFPVKVSVSMSSPRRTAEGREALISNPSWSWLWRLSCRALVGTSMGAPGVGRAKVCSSHLPANPQPPSELGLRRRSLCLLYLLTWVSCLNNTSDLLIWIWANIKSPETLWPRPHLFIWLRPCHRSQLCWT